MTDDLRLVDWGFATAAARRLTPAGPTVSADQAAEAVAGLRESARRARGPVAQITGLDTPADAPQALIVDRATWMEINAGSFSRLLDPVLSAAVSASKRPQPSATAQSVGSKVTGTEIAGLLAFMSTKVLGQYELAPGRPGEAARLLLVAPNVVQAEQDLDVVAADFRLWVCLHEETHRVQFTAVPWLRGYLNSQIAEVVATAEVDASALASMLREAVKRIADAARGDSEVSIVDLVQTPEQREIIDRITAVMSLLEGHADVVMDGVGPEVIGTIAEIRRRFTVRRQGQGFDKIIRRLLGLDAKMRQYRDGAAFCKAVIAEVGMDGLNRVWTSPATLPTKDEIADPKLWLARMDSDGSHEAIEGRSNADEPGVTPAGPGADPGGPDGSGV